MNSDNPGKYTIRKGDTVSSIAKRYGISNSDLLKMNPAITNPNMIREGQVLVVPDFNISSTPVNSVPMSRMVTAVDNTRVASRPYDVGYLNHNRYAQNPLYRKADHYNGIYSEIKKEAALNTGQLLFDAVSYGLNFVGVPGYIKNALDYAEMPYNVIQGSNGDMSNWANLAENIVGSIDKVGPMGDFLELGQDIGELYTTMKQLPNARRNYQYYQNLADDYGRWLMTTPKNTLINLRLTHGDDLPDYYEQIRNMPTISPSR